jgi:hypothetical protein
MKTKWLVGPRPSPYSRQASLSIGSPSCPQAPMVKTTKSGEWGPGPGNSRPDPESRSHPRCALQNLQYVMEIGGVMTSGGASWALTILSTCTIRYWYLYSISYQDQWRLNELNHTTIIDIEISKSLYFKQGLGTAILRTNFSMLLHHETEMHGSYIYLY